MYNLLICGNDESFRGEPWTLERNRVLEHTNDAVRARFAALNPQQLEELCGIPALIGRPVIPIVQRVDDIPFDLRHHRHIAYLNNGEGRQALFDDLVPRMRTSSERGRG